MAEHDPVRPVPAGHFDLDHIDALEVIGVFGMGVVRPDRPVFSSVAHFRRHQKGGARWLQTNY